MGPPSGQISVMKKRRVWGFLLTKDFVKHFDQLEICNVSPEIMEEWEHDLAIWHVKKFDGEWVGEETAGGCRYTYTNGWFKTKRYLSNYL